MRLMEPCPVPPMEPCPVTPNGAVSGVPYGAVSGAPYGAVSGGPYGTVSGAPYGAVYLGPNLSLPHDVNERGDPKTFIVKARIMLLLLPRLLSSVMQRKFCARAYAHVRHVLLRIGQRKLFHMNPPTFEIFPGQRYAEGFQVSSRELAHGGGIGRRQPADFGLAWLDLA